MPCFAALARPHCTAPGPPRAPSPCPQAPSSRLRHGPRPPAAAAKPATPGAGPAPTPAAGSSAAGSSGSEAAFGGRGAWSSREAGGWAASGPCCAAANIVATTTAATAAAVRTRTAERCIMVRKQSARGDARCCAANRRGALPQPAVPHWHKFRSVYMARGCHCHCTSKRASRADGLRPLPWPVCLPCLRWAEGSLGPVQPVRYCCCQCNRPPASSSALLLTARRRAQGRCRARSQPPPPAAPPSGVGPAQPAR